MKVLNGNHWKFNAAVEDGFLFINTQFPGITERLIISKVALAVEGSRMYFDYVEGKHRIRVPNRVQFNSARITEILGSQVRIEKETEHSRYIAI